VKIITIIGGALRMLVGPFHIKPDLVAQSELNLTAG
jgi:hypothetical protein